MVRIERAEELPLSQDDTPVVSTPDVGWKAAPKDLALRAQPCPVTRLNRRTLALLAGGLGVAVMGATMWSLQPKQRSAVPSRPSFTTSIMCGSPKNSVDFLSTAPSYRPRCRSRGRRCWATWVQLSWRRSRLRWPAIHRLGRMLRPTSTTGGEGAGSSGGLVPVLAPRHSARCGCTRAGRSSHAAAQPGRFRSAGRRASLDGGTARSDRRASAFKVRAARRSRS